VEKGGKEGEYVRRSSLQELIATESHQRVSESASGGLRRSSARGFMLIACAGAGAVVGVMLWDDCGIVD